MTERQPYEVVATTADYELRRYPEHLVAEVEVDGSFESAGNAGFRPLVSYIGGANHGGRSLAMTAPVIQAGTPVATEPGRTVSPTDDGRYVVAFVLPADVTAGTAPAPTDARVRVRVVAEELAAAARFTGRWTSASFRQRAEQLREAVARDGLEVTGEVRFARFDPPWTPWFLRHNEAVLPVSRP